MKIVQQPRQQEISDSPDRPFSMAIEVIGREGSIALFSGDRLIEARGLAANSRAADSRVADSRVAGRLAPAIEALACDFLPQGSLDSLGSISVAVGPGSFTGLRIAVTTAKTLGYALQIPLLAVNSLTAIAATGPPDCMLGLLAAEGESQESCGRSVLVGLAAYRGQVYRGRFQTDADPEIDLVSAEQWKQEIATACSAAGKKTANRYVFLGDRAVFERTGVAIDPDSWFDSEERAVGVGRIAAAMLRRGDVTSAMDLVPDYLRPSAAEEQV